MKHFVFKLTMPNNNSWNGKWTGEGKLYCHVRSYKENIGKKLENVLSTSGCYYDFGDGWGAYVSVEECSSSEKQQYRKRSEGFCGYDWMIDEIEEYGRILTREERVDIRNMKELISEIK